MEGMSGWAWLGFGWEGEERVGLETAQAVERERKMIFLYEILFLIF
jgi:hypothetical protein